jgi:hypothetical protein
MRAASLLSLAFTAAVAAACGSEVASVPEREETASRAVPSLERDLTLRAPAAPAVEVASPIELSQPKPTPRTTRASRPRPRPTPAPARAAQPAVEPVAVPAVALTEAAAEPPPAEEDAAAGGRELAPGETVRIIPASSGPGLEAEEDNAWLPSERPRGILVGGGGTCRPRKGARGIGIAGRIPVGIPARRLR